MDCEYIEDYFKRGFTTHEILNLLADSHGIILSKLERILSKKQLWRRKNKTNATTEKACLPQLRSKLCRHIDGYDKLKPLGLQSVDALMGFPERWYGLKLTKQTMTLRSSLATMDAVVDAGGCPARLRLEKWKWPYGWNAAVFAFFPIFAFFFHFGPSTGNQRIERWWLILRSECVQFWMDLFDKLREDGYFSDNFLIQFCFLQTIQVIDTLEIKDCPIVFLRATNDYM